MSLLLPKKKKKAWSFSDEPSGCYWDLRCYGAGNSGNKRKGLGGEEGGINQKKNTDPSSKSPRYLEKCAREALEGEKRKFCEQTGRHRGETQALTIVLPRKKRGRGQPSPGKRMTAARRENKKSF